MSDYNYFCHTFSGIIQAFTSHFLPDASRNWKVKIFINVLYAMAHFSCIIHFQYLFTKLWFGTLEFSISDILISDISCYLDLLLFMLIFVLSTLYIMVEIILLTIKLGHDSAPFYIKDTVPYIPLQTIATLHSVITMYWIPQQQLINHGAREDRMVHMHFYGQQKNLPCYNSDLEYYEKAPLLSWYVAKQFFQ